tara:strand:+ start:14684 stop:14863 length:180 start_codon:yes stop_codon:yes gene_type:complete
MEDFWAWLDMLVYDFFACVGVLYVLPDHLNYMLKLIIAWGAIAFLKWVNKDYYIRTNKR